MPLLRSRVYDRHGRIEWGQSIMATLATTGLNVRVGRLSQPIVKAFGSPMSACLKCGTAWAFVKGHVTEYKDGTGCFPLCEKCWAELTPAARMPFYRALYDLWLLETSKYEYGPDRFAVIDGYMDAWPLIQAAVRAGR